MKIKTMQNIIRLAVFVLSFALVLGFATVPAWATTEEDQVPLTEEEIAEALERGLIATTSEDLIGANLYARSGVFSDNYYAGSNRYETSALQAKAGWASGSEYALLASGEDWADALAASGLAGILDCPILLTPASGLDPYVKEALSSLGVSKVVIVGGPAVVSEGVESDLSSMGIVVEARLGGADRFETQLAIYEYGRGSWSSRGMIITRGTGKDGFADALASSSLAFSEKMPIFIAESNGLLSDSQWEGFADLIFGKTQFDVLILGGDTCVSYEVEDFVRDELGSSGACLRFAGSNRWETSSALASWAVEKGYLSADDAAFASGRSPYDALGGGALQGKRGSVLLLVGENAYLNAASSIEESGGASRIKFFGGYGAVSNGLRIQIIEALGLANADVEGFAVYLDAGHGYDSSNNGQYDPGACSLGYVEAEINAELANLVAEKLRQEYGMLVYVNDDGGWYKLRQTEALTMGCNVLVSIHFNSGGGHGSESYIHKYRPCVGSDVLQDYVHSALISGTGLFDRGQKKDELAVVGGDVPATLLEICFIDSSSDMSQYQSRKDYVASEIARGIAGR